MASLKSMGLVSSCIIIMLASLYAYNWLTTPVLRIFHAGSLTGPFAELAKRFEKENPHVKVICEPYGSREAVRRVTDLGREADVVGVSDYSVIEELMLPDYADWYIIFARNEIVIAYTASSSYRDKINSSNWYEIFARRDVKFGRSDPDADPCGYRTLMVWLLAEKYYNDPHVYERLKEKSPIPTRPTEAELVALLESGQIDYAFIYISLAIQHNLPFVRLPDQINLGNPDYEFLYSTVSVILSDGTIKTGDSIMYAVTIPKNAPYPDLAVSFIRLLLSEEGQNIISDLGLLPVSPGLANDVSSIPKDLQPFVEEVEFQFG